MPFNSAPRPERNVCIGFSSRLTVLANDKAVDSSLSRKTEESYTLEAISRQTELTEQSPYVLSVPRAKC